MTASGVTEAAKSQVRKTFDNQKGRALDEIVNLASALRQASDNLQESGSVTGSLIARAAEGLENFSRSLEEKDFDDIVRDARDFGRRNPALLLGAAVAIGFAAVRFVKSSSEALEAEQFDVEFTPDIEVEAGEPTFADRATDTAERLYSSNPLMAGLAVAAVGALIGAMVPETQKEHELMGEKRDELLSRARHVADIAKHVVSGTVTEAREPI
jgi:hypothetical protein